MATNDKDTFSGSASYYLELYTSLHSQSTAANFSTVYYRLRVYKTYGTGFYSSGSGNKGWIKSSQGDLWDDSNFSFDYRNGQYTGYWTYASGYKVFDHNSDGTGSYLISAGMDLYNLGSARVSSGTIGLPALADPPPAPTITSLDARSSETLYVKFDSNGTGGSSILQWQVATTVNNYLAGGYKSVYSNDDTELIVGLERATKYYVFVRGRNAVGWGAWSASRSATTLAEVPNAPKVTGADEITQVSFRYRFLYSGNGGSSITQRQVGYGLISGSPERFVESDGTSVITGLEPGRTYYVWARDRNAVGWSPWSVRTTVHLESGAQVRVNGTWKAAIPYVNVNGVWEVAQPYVKQSGVWKKIS